MYEKCDFYGFPMVFKGNGGFRYSLKMSLKLCKKDFHEREKGIMKTEDFYGERGANES